MNMELKALEAEMLQNERDKDKDKDKDKAKEGRVGVPASVRAIRKAQHNILIKMRARAYNGSMAYTGYQPLGEREGYSREPILPSSPSPLRDPKGEPSSAEGTGRFVVDKMLMNYRNIGLIHLLFPYATILHLVRDPMDTLYSCYKTRFADDSAAYTIDPDLLAQEYGLYIDIMRHFREQMPRASVIDINYEALVTQPRKMMSLIFRRMGKGGGIEGQAGREKLEWSEEILSFHESGTESKGKGKGKGDAQSQVVPRTASYLQVRQPLYKSSIGGWLRYGDHISPLKEAYRKHVYGPLLEQCNRDPQAEERVFPYSNTMNWAALVDFNYEDTVRGLASEEWSVREAEQQAEKAKTKSSKGRKKRKTKKTKKSERV